MARRKKESKEKLFQLKITLLNSPIPIWRRVNVKSKTPLPLLHEIFQIVMGWTNSHLHSFSKDEKTYVIADEEYPDSYLDEIDFVLADLLKSTGDSFIYQYDFGDSWDHKIVLEKIMPAEGEYLVSCKDGRRACPPEDVGGVRGFANFLDAIEDPEHPEHQSYCEWIGCRFDADSFSPMMVNSQLYELNLVTDDLEQMNSNIYEFSR